MEMGGYFYRFSLKRNDPKIPATLSTPCDIIGQSASCEISVADFPWRAEETLQTLVS